MYTKMAAARFLKPYMGDMTICEICDMLEYPADRKMGDLALPCFKLSKVLRKAPPMIAQSLCEAVNAIPESGEMFEKIENVNGYLNFYLSKAALAEDLFAMDDEKYG